VNFTILTNFAQTYEQRNCSQSWWQLL